MKYQTWINYGSEGWSFNEFDTFDEAYKDAIENSHGSAYKITKSVEYKVIATEE